MGRNARKPRVPKDMFISNRPETINKREEFGHWKVIMMFKQGIKSNLITLRERKTRFIVGIKNINKTASNTAALTLISTIKKIRKHLRSITFDQGSEFNSTNG